jgi:hypothetical protein
VLARLPPPLVTDAVRVLDDARSPPGLVAVAVATLARSITCRVPQHPRGGAALLEAVFQRPEAIWATEACDALAVLDDPKVTDRVVAVLRNPDADVFHLQAALRVARGEPHVVAITDTLLLVLAEQVTTRGIDAGAVANLVGAVSHFRAIRQDLAKLIVDLWSSRPSRWTLIACMDVVAYAHLPVSVEWVRQMLTAADELVRCAAAGRVGELCDHSQAIRLLSDAARTEQLPHVKAEMLRALADLVGIETVREVIPHELH